MLNPLFSVPANIREEASREGDCNPRWRRETCGSGTTRSWRYCCYQVCSFLFIHIFIIILHNYAKLSIKYLTSNLARSQYLDSESFSPRHAPTCETAHPDSLCLSNAHALSSIRQSKRVCSIKRFRRFRDGNWANWHNRWRGVNGEAIGQIARKGIIDDGL